MQFSHDGYDIKEKESGKILIRGKGQVRTATLLSQMTLTLALV